MEQISRATQKCADWVSYKMMKNFERYNKAIYYLESLSNLPIEGDYMIGRSNAGEYLKKMRYFLELIGNPDKGMNFIHVTGTAGKGTVTNLIHEMLNSAGKNVGSHTSPFVTTTIEKFKVKDKYIDPNEFADIVEYLKPFIDKAYIEGPFGRPSYFEIILAIAFIYFKRQKCEWVVLEVGCGGRYDGTNVVENPKVTAITNIDYDHIQILGKTLNKIAYDKAGIIKSGSEFFTTEQRPALLKMFKNICQEKSVRMNKIGYKENYMEYNFSLATAIAKHLGIDEKNIERGIKKSRMQCRFEKVQDKPIVILDGAHNRVKIASTIENLKNLKYKKLHLIIGMGYSKDHVAILEQIIPLADNVFITRFQVTDRECAHPKMIFEESKKYLKKDSNADIFLDPEMAIEKALKLAKVDDLILVTGSFFLAGGIRKRWFREEFVLNKRESF